MRFIIKVHVDEVASTYLVDAKDEAQAKERLLLRFPPNKRDKVKIDDITIDPATISSQDPYGMFAD